jgi:hypothetical protein
MLDASDERSIAPHHPSLDEGAIDPPLTPQLTQRETIGKSNGRMTLKTQRPLASAAQRFGSAVADTFASNPSGFGQSAAPELLYGFIRTHHLHHDNHIVPTYY